MSVENDDRERGQYDRLMRMPRQDLIERAARAMIPIRLPHGVSMAVASKDDLCRALASIYVHGAPIRHIKGERVKPRHPEAVPYDRLLEWDRDRAAPTRNYNFVVFQGPRPSAADGVAIVMATAPAGAEAAKAARAFARKTPGSYIYNVSRGAHDGWVNYAGNYVSFRRGH